MLEPWRCYRISGLARKKKKIFFFFELSSELIVHQYFVNKKEGKKLNFISSERGIPYSLIYCPRCLVIIHDF